MTNEAKQDIIVINKEGDKYSFYIVDRICLLKATLDEIKKLAKYNHAQVSYFPTQDEVIAEFRENLEILGSKEILLQRFAEMVKIDN